MNATTAEMITMFQDKKFAEKIARELFQEALNINIDMWMNVDVESAMSSNNIIAISHDLAKENLMRVVEIFIENASQALEEVSSACVKIDVKI